MNLFIVGVIIAAIIIIFGIIIAIVSYRIFRNDIVNTRIHEKVV